MRGTPFGVICIAGFWRARLRMRIATNSKLAIAHQGALNYRLFTDFLIRQKASRRTGRQYR